MSAYMPDFVQTNLYAPFATCPALAGLNVEEAPVSAYEPACVQMNLYAPLAVSPALTGLMWRRLQGFR